MNKIRALIEEKFEFSASLAILSKVLKGQRFSYKRYVQNRKVLMERPDIVRPSLVMSLGATKVMLMKSLRELPVMSYWSFTECQQIYNQAIF